MVYSEQQLMGLAAQAREGAISAIQTVCELENLNEKLKVPAEVYQKLSGMIADSEYLEATAESIPDDVVWPTPPAQ